MKRYKKYLVIIVIIFLVIFFVLQCSKKEDFNASDQSAIVEIFNAYNLQQGNENYSEYLDYVKKKYNLYNEENYKVYIETIDKIKSDEEEWNKFLLLAKNYRLPSNWKQLKEELEKKSKDENQDDKGDDKKIE